MKWRSWLIVFVGIIGLVAALGFIKYRQIASAIEFAESFPEPSETVSVVSATLQQYTRRETAIGEVVPLQSLEIRNELAGTIVSVGFEPGERVEANRTLVRLDTREETARLQAAMARAELAKLTLDRNESLLTSSAASRQAADTARADQSVALADADQLRVVIDKKDIRAPFDALTSLHEWQVGQFIDSGTVIATLVGTQNEKWIDFFLPQEIANSNISSQVTIIDSTSGEHPADIIAENPAIDANSRNREFRAMLTDGDQQFAPGSIVRVVVTVGEVVPLIGVPATAVRRDAFGPHVFVLVDAESGADAPMRATRREVSIRQIIGEQAFLSEGLQAGERVAGDGAFKLRDGLLVNPAETAP